MKTLLLLMAAYICCHQISFSQSTPVSKTQLPKIRPWLLTGNKGTDTSVNFIGTKDAMPLRFKVNNERAGYIDYHSEPGGNTGFGFQSLNPASANWNTAFGFQALSDNEAALNTAIGARALYSNIGGNGNTALGVSALQSNLEGANNTAVGLDALNFNSYGSNNTATGISALGFNMGGWMNTATGFYTLAINTSGGWNTANGVNALFYNSTGNYNTGIGSDALYLNGFGGEANYNTAVGSTSLYNNETGNSNTATGNLALYHNQTGNHNAAFGDSADVTTGDLNNATAIGSKALVDASNKVRVGNESVSSIGGQVGWTQISDEQVKKGIQENVPGLQFIKTLRPITYHVDIDKQNELMNVKHIPLRPIELQGKTIKDIARSSGKEILLPETKNN